MGTRSGKLIVNSVYSVVAWMAPLLMAFLATPFVLKRIGTEVYGVYLVVLGFIGYSFTFNAARAVAKFVAELRGSQNVQKINSAVTVAFALNLSVGVIGACILAFLAEWLVGDVLHISPELQRPAALAIMIGGLSIPAMLVGQVFQNILQGEQRFGTLSLIANLNSALVNGGNVLLALTGFSIVALLIWSLSVTVAVSMVSLVAARRASPDLGITLNVSREMVRPVVAYSSSMYVYQLCGGALLLFERGLIVRNFGEAAAAYYVVPMTLAIYFHGFLTSVLTAAFPLLNELLNDDARLAALHRKSTKLLIAVTIPFFLTILLGGQMFLALWIDKEFAANAYWLFVIHGATFSLMALMLAAWQLNETHHAASLNAWITFISSAVSVGLMLYSVGPWHSEGVALSRLAGVLLVVPIIFYSEKRFLGDVNRNEWVSQICRLIPAALVFSVTEFLFFTFVGASWLTLVVGTLTALSLYGLVLYATRFISEDEKVLLFSLLGRSHG